MVISKTCKDNLRENSISLVTPAITTSGNLGSEKVIIMRRMHVFVAKYFFGDMRMYSMGKCVQKKEQVPGLLLSPLLHMS